MKHATITLHLRWWANPLLRAMVLAARPVRLLGRRAFDRYAEWSLDTAAPWIARRAYRIA